MVGTFEVHAPINAFLIDEDWWNEPTFIPGII